MGQSNSEHSRHWFFGGKLVIDGVEMQDTLFQLVKKPWKVNPGNSVCSFDKFIFIIQDNCFFR